MVANQSCAPFGALLFGCLSRVLGTSAATADVPGPGQELPKLRCSPTRAPRRAWWSEGLAAAGFDPEDLPQKANAL